MRLSCSILLFWSVSSLALRLSHGLSNHFVFRAPEASSQSISRRQVLDSLIIGTTGVAASFLAVSPPPALAEEEEIKEETAEERKARLLKEKIAASKKNYRKASDYMDERFTTVDYSCVADTGSPCKEPKSVFPSDEQIARDGLIPDL